jgi:hypothetical protein
VAVPRPRAQQYLAVPLLGEQLVQRQQQSLWLQRQG